MNIVTGLFLVLGMSLSAFSQPVDSTQSTTDLFSSDNPIKMELEFHYKEFIKGKYKDEYLPAKLSLLSNDSTSIVGDIRMKARGAFRKRYCVFPPIKLNFKKSKFTEPQLKDLTTLKLVTTCKYSKTYQQYLFKEYLIYKIFNLLTPLSFRARLVDISYKDSNGKKKPFQQFGFIIEHVDHVAARNNSFEIEPKTIYPSQVEKKQYLLVAIFNYMIGNTDYYVGNLHNVKLLKSNNPTQTAPYVVPYDFDYSGVVNAIYAIPHESLAIEKVTDRLYRGPCFTLQEVENITKELNVNKEEMLAVFEDSPYLLSYMKKDSKKFIESFFRIINNPKRIKSEILSTCY